MPRRRARIVAIAPYLPEGRLTNEDLAAQFPEWTPEKISDKTGIDCRRVAEPDEFTSDLAVKAGEALFEKTDVAREDIDFLMLMTLSPDYVIPFTAGMIQDRLGLPKTVGAFDSTLGCSGYVYGLGLAAALIESGRARNVLLVTADKFAPYTIEGDKSVKTIFGDGATATLIEAVDEDQISEVGRGGIIGAADFGTDGSGSHNLVARTSSMRGFAGNESVSQSCPTLEMNGPEVFNFTLSTVSKHIKGFLKENEVAVDDVALFVFHQANGFMLEHLRKRMKIPAERFAVHLADTGNTLASTIPIALAHSIDQGRVPPGSKVMLVGFGVGYSWGSVLVDYPG